MESKIAVLLGKALLNYLKDHPEAVLAFSQELAKRIPGKVDDKVVAFLAAFFKNLV